MFRPPCRWKCVNSQTRLLKPRRFTNSFSDSDRWTSESRDSHTEFSPTWTAKAAECFHQHFICSFAVVGIFPSGGSGMGHTSVIILILTVRSDVEATTPHWIGPDGVTHKVTLAFLPFPMGITLKPHLTWASPLPPTWDRPGSLTGVWLRSNNDFSVVRPSTTRSVECKAGLLGTAEGIWLQLLASGPCCLLSPWLPVSRAPELRDPSLSVLGLLSCSAPKSSRLSATLHLLLPLPTYMCKVTLTPTSPRTTEASFRPHHEGPSAHGFSEWLQLVWGGEGSWDGSEEQLCPSQHNITVTSCVKWPSSWPGAVKTNSPLLTSSSIFSFVWVWGHLSSCSCVVLGWNVWLAALQLP